MQSLNHLTEQNFSLVALQIIANDISELQKNQATTVAKIAQYKRKLMDLSHRVLQVPALFLFFVFFKVHNSSSRLNQGP